MNQKLAVMIDNVYGVNYLENIAMANKGFVYFPCCDNLGLAIKLTSDGIAFASSLVLSDEEKAEYYKEDEILHDYELAHDLCNTLLDIGIASEIYYSFPEMYE